MDAQTLAAYEADAARQAAYQRSVTPGPVHRLAAAFFHPREPTADVGCGSGRDTAWLVRQGFPAVGYEPVAAMRAEALAAFPNSTCVRPLSLTSPVCQTGRTATSSATPC